MCLFHSSFCCSFLLFPFNRVCNSERFGLPISLDSYFEVYLWLPLPVNVLWTSTLTGYCFRKWILAAVNLCFVFFFVICLKFMCCSNLSSLSSRRVCLRIVRQTAGYEAQWLLSISFLVSVVPFWLHVTLKALIYLSLLILTLRLTSGYLHL